jgi:superfamily II DNA or RNA helicase
MKQAIWQEPEILCHYEYYPTFVQLTPEEMAEYTRITDQLRRFIDPDTGVYRKPDADNLLLKRKRVIHKAANKKKALIELLDQLGGTRLEYAFVFVPEGYEPDYSDTDSHTIQAEDEHIIQEYAAEFRRRNYTYHNYISGIEDAQTVLKNFAEGRIKVLLSMKCLDEGVDIPRAEYAIFCASTGNPRQFVQRRGRVLRKCKGKKLAKIWDLVVIPPEVSDASKAVEKNMFMGEVRRIVNFAILADNKERLLNGELMNLCERLEIPLNEIIEREENLY